MPTVIELLNTDTYARLSPEGQTKFRERLRDKIIETEQWQNANVDQQDELLGSLGVERPGFMAPQIAGVHRSLGNVVRSGMERVEELENPPEATAFTADPFARATAKAVGTTARVIREQVLEPHPTLSGVATGLAAGAAVGAGLASLPLSGVVAALVAGGVYETTRAAAKAPPPTARDLALEVAVAGIPAIGAIKKAAGARKLFGKGAKAADDAIRAAEEAKLAVPGATPGPQQVVLGAEKTLLTPGEQALFRSIKQTAGVAANRDLRIAGQLVEFTESLGYHWKPWELEVLAKAPSLRDGLLQLKSFDQWLRRTGPNFYRRRQLLRDLNSFNQKGEIVPQGLVTAEELKVARAMAERIKSGRLIEHAGKKYKARSFVRYGEGFRKAKPGEAGPGPGKATEEFRRQAFLRTRIDPREVEALRRSAKEVGAERAVIANTAREAAHRTQVPKMGHLKDSGFGPRVSEVAKPGVTIRAEYLKEHYRNLIKQVQANPSLTPEQKITIMRNLEAKMNKAVPKGNQIKHELTYLDQDPLARHAEMVKSGEINPKELPAFLRAMKVLEALIGIEAGSQAVGSALPSAGVPGGTI